VVTGSDVAPWRVIPLVGFIVPSLTAEAKRVVALLQRAWNGGAVDQGGRVCPESDAVLLMPVRSHPDAAPGSRAQDICSCIQHSHLQAGVSSTLLRGASFNGLDFILGLRTTRGVLVGHSIP
jgi:hypothetical protein